MTLKAIDFEVMRGELICIIGDTGSGKSSLLNAIIGDMIYVPQECIDEFGGLDKEGDKESYEKLKTRVLGPDFKVSHKPIQVNGALSFVEQKSWI